KDLPPNLYKKKDSRNGKTYYTYRDPETGRVYGLGSDKAAAITQAHDQNRESYFKTGPVLTERIAAGPRKTLSDWIVEFRLEYAKRCLSESSVATIGRRLNQIDKALGSHGIREIGTFEIATYLKGIEAEGKASMARAMRSLLQDVFREANARGWRSDNPVTVTRAARVRVQRQRLTLELWKLIHAEVHQPWMKRAMELALLTGQRRDDIRNMLFKDVSDGVLHVIQQKTGARLRISTALRLECVGLQLSEVIKSCRDSVISKHLIHHPSRASSAVAGTPVTLNVLTMTFAAARDRAAAKAGIVLGDSPPSFHEMRSLASRLHELEGRDTQKLLGHKTAAMTDLYRDGRGVEWIDVA
ncbi:MAG: Site-specific recombinase, phage integrase family, partial [Pseudomonas sp.]|uniref:phage integrase Arm DNA-binding domain-containing protein n=1 Tax=Pseudomonas sp. TaxID=306 RepID=UPI00262E0606